MPQSFPVHEKCVFPDTSTAVCMTSEALGPPWSVNANSEAYVGAESSGPFTVDTGAGASTGTGVALTDALNSAVTQVASLASQAATSASQAATAAAWDKTIPISRYPLYRNNVPLESLTIGTLIKSNSILDVLKKNHETKIGNLPAEIIFKAIKEHAAGNESQFPSEVDLMNDCRLAALTGCEFSFALTDSAGTMIHLFQGNKFFTQQVDGTLQMGGLVNCDPKEEKCPPSYKKILIEIVKDKSIIHFFEKLKNIAQSLHTSTVDSNNKIKHKVFGGLTQNNMLITSMPINLSEVLYGSIMAYTEIPPIRIHA